MKKLVPLLLIAISSFITKTNAQVDVNDSLALVDFYHSTNGDIWNQSGHWLKGPVIYWEGITVEYNRVVEIYLSYKKYLDGSLPESIGNLTLLRILHINKCKLRGKIPASIGNLTALQYLNLFDNKLSGIIPESIGNLTELLSLDLGGNDLKGIPESIGNLHALQNLSLSFNNFNGVIPENIGNLVELHSLDLSYAQLNGVIPESIGNLINLNNLKLENNRLSGVIPESMGNLAELPSLNLSYNYLSGVIPESMGNLTALHSLDLSHNQLNGVIPESIGNLAALGYLDLSYNQLSGTIPESIGNLASLYSLFLYYNRLSGTIPESIANLKQLQSLFLSNNLLSGGVYSLLYLDENARISIYSNYFTFENMEELVQYFSYYLIYAPQAIIPLHQQANILSVSAGGTLANNTYKWYRDGTLVATNVGDSTYTITVDGAYHVNVTNSICTELTLYSDTITTTILPLTLLNFTASLQKNNALLSWATTNEINTKEFVVQRSTDGQQFTNIGKQNAKGNSSTVTNFFYTDAGITALRTNKIYYRLQQMDMDGNSNYSKTIVLNLSNTQNSFTIYPIPVKNILHIKGNGKAIYVLHSSEGKILLTKTIDGNGEINMIALAAGVYYLKNITTSEERKVIVR